MRPNAIRPTAPDVATRVAVLACGALARDLAEIAERQGLPLDVFALPPVLHNRPDRIAAAVEVAAEQCAAYGRIVVGYADCGTYGALDDLCRRRGWNRLPGLHCYDLYAGPTQIAALLAEQPGSYFLTDFLVLAFDRLVIRELGLDRYPELRETYFGQYTRVVWLTADPHGPLRAEADRAAARLGLRLQVVPGAGHLDAALSAVLG